MSKENIIEELAADTGLNCRFLYLLSNHIPEYYRICRISKKNGKSRTIEAPAPVLKRIQRHILRHILPGGVANNPAELLAAFPQTKPGRSPAATAFERGCSIRKNAEKHCGKPVVITLDVKDFFPSLRYRLVRSLFQRIVREDAAAVMLAKFCTLNGHLPQGAVTSPRLSNLLLLEFDEALLRYARLHELAFTRYADDLTFSGDPSDAEIAELIRVCRGELRKLGLRLNRDKIRVRRQGMRQEVTGVVVNAKAAAPREVRRRLRQRMYYLNKHWEREWRDLDEHSLNVLLGQANFIWDLDRSDPETGEYRRQLLEIRRNFDK